MKDVEVKKLPEYEKISIYQMDHDLGCSMHRVIEHAGGWESTREVGRARKSVRVGRGASRDQL